MDNTSPVNYENLVKLVWSEYRLNYEDPRIKSQMTYDYHKKIEPYFVYGMYHYDECALIHYYFQQLTKKHDVKCVARHFIDLRAPSIFLLEIAYVLSIMIFKHVKCLLTILM